MTGNLSLHEFIDRCCLLFVFMALQTPLLISQVVNFSATVDNLQIPKTLDTVHSPFFSPVVFGSSMLLGGLAIHYWRYTPLWHDYKTSFFVKENFTYALNQDKLLHFYGASLGASLLSSTYEVAGIEPTSSEVYGIAGAALLLSLVEVEDGHISYLGFDRSDFAADLAGAFYSLAQRQVPLLRSFTPKMSYHTSGRNVTVSGQRLSGKLGDHEGQTFWLGITVQDLLPVQWQSFWPSMLGIAVGRGVAGLDTDQPNAFVLVGLDIDLRKLPASSPWLRRVWNILNYIRMPLPTVKISHGTVWYGLYF